MKKIVAFSGSNNSQSINKQLLNFAVEKITASEVTLLDLSDYPLPIYGLDVEAQGIPDEAYAIQKILFAHDALILATPEHNGSIPAYLKNVIDWLSRLVPAQSPFFGDAAKPILLMSTSPGATGGASNLKALAGLMPWWGGDVKGTYSLGSFYEVAVDGKLVPETDKALTTVIKDFESQL